MPSSSWFHRLFSIVSDVHFLGEVYPAAFLVIIVIMDMAERFVVERKVG